ncbi:quinone oxidoreductase family protein [Rhodobaculum claviforme]|uniref:Quinone oxidoreductase n=1 Tax=Rhodobaculum claviforme TaxID=1549854 RepID=A0A934TLY3_9RHOB|nr:quinone oxidoreductase [Rhodobaculum claviforme]MBK5927969.1 quinone oxidoreductase [Rhodobaculum claviforme]
MDYAMVMPQPGGPELFERREITVPDPAEGEVRVRHTAIGLNYLDVYHRSGAYPWPVERDLVAGSEAAGVVEAVGAGVSNLKPGDRVAYTHPMNAYCSARVLPAHRLVKLPDGISDEIAATLMLKGLTAHYLIHSSYPVARGTDVLVHAAAGGVGLLMGQWLAAKGARAIGTAGGPDKVALALRHGYTDVIDYRAGDFVAPVRDLTGGRGVDVVYDGVGADTWRGSLDSLVIRGSFVCFGAASGKVEGFGLADLNKGSFFATRPTLFHHIADPEELRSRAADLFAVVQGGAVRSAVSQTFALSEVGAAHAALEGRQTTGATVLIP